MKIFLSKENSLQKKINFCGVYFTDITAENCLNLIYDTIKEKKGLSITFVDLKTFMALSFSKKKRNRLNSIDLILPKSVFLKNQITKVYPDYQYQDIITDILTPILRKFYAKDTDFMFLGASKAGMSRLTLSLQSSFPKIRMIGLYPREFVLNHEEDVRSMVFKGDVRVLFVGLGRYNDEEWILKNKDVLANTAAICVQNRIDVMAGDKKDIPYQYRVENKEYLFFLKKNPLRIFDSIVWFYVMLKTFFFKIRLKRALKKGKEL